MIRVLIVDDHPVVGQGLRLMLQDHDDVEVVGVLTRAHDLPDEVAQRKPDVVLLDLEMPEVDGLSVLPHLTRARVIVFTAYDDGDRVVSAMQAGARGYILKGAPGDEIVQAIHSVQAGGTWLQPRVAAHLVHRLTHAPAEALSGREREALSALSDGLSNKEIAVRLGISERTVKFHLNGVFNKLGVDSRTRAVVVGMEKGLLPVHPDRGNA